MARDIMDALVSKMPNAVNAILRSPKPGISTSTAAEGGKTNVVEVVLPGKDADSWV